MVQADLGIDVAKRKLDVVLLREGSKQFRVFANEPFGWRDLLGWLAQQQLVQVHACLEATGRYGECVAEYLHQAGHVVSVVNPAQSRISHAVNWAATRPIRSMPASRPSSA